MDAKGNPLPGLGGIGVSPASVTPGVVSVGPGSATDITSEGTLIGDAVRRRQGPKTKGGACQFGGKLAGSVCRGLF